MATFRVVKTENRSFSGGPSQAASAQITYTVSPTGTDTPPATEFEAQQAVKAEFGTRHPDYPMLVWSRDDTRPRSGADNVMEVTITYELITTRGPTDDPDDDQQPGFVAFNVDLSGRFIDVWRNQSSGQDDWLPSEAALLNGQMVPEGITVDIEGEKLDSEGHAVSGSVRQQDLSVIQVIDRLPLFSLYRTMVHTRNNAVVWGADKGFLLYLGASSSRIATNVYRVEHRFAWDSWAHLRQFPVMDKNSGHAKTDANGNATTVYWVQPFPEVSDFQQLGIEGLDNL
jgi:hypothetical protein